MEITYEELKSQYIDLEEKIQQLNKTINKILDESIPVFIKYNDKTNYNVIKQYRAVLSQDREEIDRNNNRADGNEGEPYASRYYQSINDRRINNKSDDKEKKRYLIEYPECPTKEEFEKNKSEEIKKIYKLNAVISIKIANAVNLTKRNNGTYKDNKKIYDKKDQEIEQFLIETENYNKLVSEDEKIYYGFEIDEEGIPAINVSVPGNTRISLHFGSKENFLKI